MPALRTIKKYKRVLGAQVRSSFGDITVCTKEKCAIHCRQEHIKRQREKKRKAALKYNVPMPHWQRYDECHLAFAANVACSSSTNSCYHTHTHHKKKKKKCSHPSCNPSGVPASSVFGSLRNLRTCPSPLGPQHGAPVSKATPCTRRVKNNTPPSSPKPFHTHCFAVLYMVQQETTTSSFTHSLATLE